MTPSTSRVRALEAELLGSALMLLAAQIEELKRCDARLVDAFAQGVLSVDELRSKREAIRRERDAFEQTLRPKPAPDNASLLVQAWLVVKAALRFFHNRWCCW